MQQRFSYTEIYSSAINFQLALNDQHGKSWPRC